MIARKVLLEAVTVCVGYSDFLAEVIPCNLPQIDLWTVVTTPDDRATQNLCVGYGINCLKTTCFNRDVPPPRLNKARGINYGLAHQSHAGWVLHLDGDIALPPQFRKMLENADLDETKLYGMDRVDCPDAATWDSHLDRCRRGSHRQYDCSCFIRPPVGMGMGTRLTHGDYGGYCPIGYFQMWNPAGSGVYRYPVKIEGDMEHTDMLFAIQWERRQRELLPEGFCVHLQTGRGDGENWRGRRSPPFRGVAPDHKVYRKPASY